MAVEPCLRRRCDGRRGDHGHLFFSTIGIRSDIMNALETVRFPFKFVVTLALAVTATGLTLRMARPGAPPGPWIWGLAAAPLLLLLGVLAELLVMPEATWLRG